MLHPKQALSCIMPAAWHRPAAAVHPTIHCKLQMCVQTPHSARMCNRGAHVHAQGHMGSLEPIKWAARQVPCGLPAEHAPRCGQTLTSAGSE